MMNSFIPRRLLSLACCFAVVSSLVAQQAQADEEAKQEKATHSVAVKPLRIEVQLSGTAVAENMTEVSIEPNSWADWTVEEAVNHGVFVREGDVLVRFNPKKLDSALTDLEFDLELNHLSMEQAKRELPLFEKTLEMDTEDVERAHRIAQEDTQHFLDVEAELARRSAELSLKSSRQRYENTLEELIQLEKMYEADELIEETEEIILKRQRHAVEAAKFSLERAEISHARTMQVGLDRQADSVKRKLERSEISTEQAMRKVDITKEQKKIEHAKQKLGRKRMEEKMDKLRQDREAMVLHAPAEGVIYFGSCVDGKWGKISTMRAKLRPHGKVTAHEVFMTIVGEGPIHVTTTVSEADLSKLKPGMEAVVSFPALGKKSVAGRVESISSTIVSDGKFAVELSLDDEGRVEGLTPGMSCKIKLEAYANRNAIMVPKTAVFADSWDSEDQYVIVVDDEGNETKKSVETGHEKDKNIEVVEGLEVGDRILLDPKSKGE